MRKRLPAIFLTIVLLLTLSACRAESEPTVNPFATETGSIQTAEESSTDSKEEYLRTEPESTLKAESVPEETEQNFILPEGGTLVERIAVPAGYVRTSCSEGSFGSFVRSYPLKPDGSPVLLWTKEEKPNQSGHVAVFDMRVEDEMDVQQCADSVMRIYAEYFRATGQYDRIKFHFVGGFLCDYNTYIEGNRIRMNGDDAYWVQSKKAEDSDDVFNEYMFIVSAYASTLSMDEESEPIGLQDLRIGDIFLKSGSPGHVVMVADLCEKDGKKAFLLAQGYMPAQEFHIVRNPRHENDPWYYEEEVEYPFRTQAYTFPEGSLRRPEY